MSHIQELTRRYHEKFHPDTHNTTPEELSFELLGFRSALFEEESQEAIDAHAELCVAIEVGADRTSASAHLLQELADTVIVAFGTAERLGFDLEPICTAVMRAGMRKVRNPDPAGKALKPPGWVSPLEVVEAMVRLRAAGEQAAADPFEQPRKLSRLDTPLGPVKVPGAGLPSIGPVFMARFTSPCAGCDDDLEEGESARMVDGEAWHEKCADEVAEDDGLSFDPNDPHSGRY